MAYIKKIWKDYPDATTPILASDMNNMEDGIEALDTRLNDEEMYVQATAGANGDFFVNLTNQTLVNGRIVKISFPSATNSSSNARLSIDGGVTYKNIKVSNDSLILIGIQVQNKKYEMIYDGTQWLLRKGSEVLIYDVDVSELNQGLNAGIQGDTTTNFNFNGYSSLEFGFIMSAGDPTGSKLYWSYDFESPSTHTQNRITPLSLGNIPENGAVGIFCNGLQITRSSIVYESTGFFTLSTSGLSNGFQSRNNNSRYYVFQIVGKV